MNTNQRKTNRLEKSLFTGFLIFGLIFLAVGAVICSHIFDYSNKVDTIGHIQRIDTHEDVDGDTQHSVLVAYEADGREYEAILTGYSSSFYVGKEIDIYYHKNDPTKIGMKSLDHVFLIFPSLGLIFSSVGAVPLLVKHRAKKKAELLREQGRRIDARYIETVINTHYHVNRQHPYRIICEWTDPFSHETRRFKSENLWYDPSGSIAEREITDFPVYIDRNNPKKYVVDTSKLFD